jgi:rhamnosyl/mannosyltransferase
MSSQFTILQLSKYYPPTMGGIELVAKMMSKAHIELGHKVEILSFGNGEDEYIGEFTERVTQINTDIVLMSAPINWKFIFRFRKYLETQKIDKIYVHLPNPYMHHLLWINQSYFKKNKIKLSAVYHSDLVNQKVLGPVYDLYFKGTMNIYDEVICSSEKLWKSSKILNRPNVNVKPIPFCVDSDNKFRLREGFNKKLVAIGRFVPYKGFEFLLKTISQTDYELTIIGDGPLKESLKKYESDKIKLVGRVSHAEKQKIINDSDLLIMSSINRSEAYGMIIVEAFENGMPVIAANINSGVTYLAKAGERGEIFEINSSSQLIEALKKIEKDPSLMKIYSQNVRDFFDKYLTFEAFKNNISLLDK